MSDSGDAGESESALDAGTQRRVVRERDPSEFLVSASITGRKPAGAEPED